jgi:hypothetical protein
MSFLSGPSAIVDFHWLGRRSLCEARYDANLGIVATNVRSD